MIYLLTAIGLPPGGSSTVQYTFTHKQYTEQHNETEYLERLGYGKIMLKLCKIIVKTYFKINLTYISNAIRWCFNDNVHYHLQLSKLCVNSVLVF